MKIEFTKDGDYINYVVTLNANSQKGRVLMTHELSFDELSRCVTLSIRDIVHMNNINTKTI